MRPVLRPLPYTYSPPPAAPCVCCGGQVNRYSGIAYTDRPDKGELVVKGIESQRRNEVPWGHQWRL